MKYTVERRKGDERDIVGKGRRRGRRREEEWTQEREIYEKELGKRRNRK